MSWQNDIKNYLEENKPNNFIIKKKPKSNTSYQFKINAKPNCKEGIKEGLINLFKLTNPHKYDLFDQVCSGSGNEAAKINTIWSSSLLSFLCFSEAIQHGIEVKDITYTRCFFEFKNPVLKKVRQKHPSNVDCVLTDDSFENILFIESKMIEYVRDARVKKPKKNPIENCYNDEYTQDLYRLLIKMKEEDNTEKKKYFYGIKQLITHYSGIRNFREGNFYRYYKNNDPRKELFKHNKAKLHLMEIIYDVTDVTKDKKYEIYKKHYLYLEKQIIDKINSLNKNLNIDAYPLVTYQEFFGKGTKNELENKNILKFFFHQ